MHSSILNVAYILRKSVTPGNDHRPAALPASFGADISISGSIKYAGSD
jgi:hypothetical protein